MTVGEDEVDALRRGGAIEEALVARWRDDIP
jgi:hypothetical protein